MFSYLIGDKKEGPHLLPSATLWKNSSMDNDAHWRTQLRNAHGLQQWWKSDGELSLIPKQYTYPVA
jgi:hypothetical protein